MEIKEQQWDDADGRDLAILRFGEWPMTEQKAW